MTRRPHRLIRLAQQLANKLGLDIDQDADVMTEEDLRELLNAAIDYVQEAEAYRQRQIARPSTMPNIIGSDHKIPPYTWTYSPTTYTLEYTHGSVSDKQFYTAVNSS